MILIRNPQFSFLLSKKSLVLIVIALSACIIAFTLSLTLGAEMLTLNEVLQYFTGKLTGSSWFILHELRIPRSFTALIAGGALGISGCIVQALIKNPLATPDLLGISSGGTIGTLVYMFWFQSILPYAMMPLFTGLGCTLSLSILLVFLKKKVRTLQIIFMGLAINTILGAIITGSMLFSNEFTGSSFYVWTIGSTYGSSWENLSMMNVLFASLCFISIPLGFLLDVHYLSDDLVISFGRNLNKERQILLFIAAMFSAVAVAYTGPVGFVGLIAPHCAKKITPYDYKTILPMSFFIGAIITLIADTLGRILAPPYEFPLGIFTAIIGAPYFLFILLKTGTGK
ncbi:MAG: FecCD family ABC transporter permease [Brevinema sp.]